MGEGLPFSQVDTQCLAAILGRLASVPRYAAAAALLGPQIAADDGAGRAAELIIRDFGSRALP
jgi:hypothetical protein